MRTSTTYYYKYAYLRYLGEVAEEALLVTEFHSKRDYPLSFSLGGSYQVVTMLCM